jgi:hypothetical protein
MKEGASNERLRDLRLRLHSDDPSVAEAAADEHDALFEALAPGDFDGPDRHRIENELFDMLNE